MIIKAFAKINLTLDITGILPNGYHGLRSVMVPVSLCDEIHIEHSTDFSFDCNIRSIATDDNLCVRAAKAFFEKKGIPQNVHIKLIKKVPFPAGLGGGSADAAAVLKGLNQLFSNPLSDDEILSICAELGSDVSMCYVGKPALCEGKGDDLTVLKGLPVFNLVIAIGEGRLSTPAVYKAYDNANLAPLNDSENFLKALQNSDVDKLIKSCGNAFTPIADNLCPETKEIRQHMLALGALTSNLSGSGPSVYGLFSNEQSALKAVESLKAKGYDAYYCQTLN